MRLIKIVVERLPLEKYVKVIEQDVMVRDNPFRALIDPNLFEDMKQQKYVNIIHIPAMGAKYGAQVRKYLIEKEKQVHWYSSTRDDPAEFKIFFPYWNRVPEPGYLTIIVDDAFKTGYTLGKACRGLEKLGFNLSNPRYYFAIRADLSDPNFVDDPNINAKRPLIIAPLSEFYPEHYSRLPKDEGF